MSFGARILLTLLSWLPRRLLQVLGALTGRLHHFLNSRAAKVTRANLALCMPDQDPGLARASLVETGKAALETPAVWLGNPDRIDAWIADVHGEALFAEAVAEGRGLLVLLPHIGNWELFNIFYRRYGTMTALYQPPRVPWMQGVMADVRSRRGNQMVPADRAGVKTLFRTLQQGGTVVVLPDQVPSSGVYVPFFGHEALTDELAGRLLHRTGARALGLAILRREDGRFDIHVMQPDEDVYLGDERAAAAVNRLVERAVSLAPAQYQWEYKRFRERPAGELYIYRFGKPARRY